MLIVSKLGNIRKWPSTNPLLCVQYIEAIVPQAWSWSTTITYNWS